MRLNEFVTQQVAAPNVRSTFRKSDTHGTPKTMRRAGYNLFSEQFNGALRLAYLEGVALQLFAMQAAAASPHLRV